MALAIHKSQNIIQEKFDTPFLNNNRIKNATRRKINIELNNTESSVKKLANPSKKHIKMKYRSNDVLVVVPLTDEGKIVLKQAIYLQKIISFRIFVLNVIPPISFLNRHFNSQKVEELKKEAFQKLNDFVKDFFGGEIPEKVILKVSMGNLVPILIKHTQSDDFLFIVLKRSMHQKGISNLLDQNEMDKIIAHSQCPVLSVNEESTQGELKTILVPIDISESTKKRLLWASMFAKKPMQKF